MVTTRPPKTIVKPTALGPVANTDTKLLIYGLFQKGRILAQDGGGTASCWRRATFSRASSRRALKAATRARTNDEVIPAWSRQTGD